MRIVIPLLVLALVLAPVSRSAPTPDPAAEMARAANALLQSLTDEQREVASFAFGDEERLNWHFIPRERRGLPLRHMTVAQRELVRALLETGLSQRGLFKAHTIIELELVLREMGGNPAIRDPELYYVTVFGTPTEAGPWGWRFEGHHLSLNFTVVDGAPVAWAPAFLGADPAEVRQGSRAGLRALGEEEDLARELVRSLDPAQRGAAIVAANTPRDIITGTELEIDPLSPAGIPITELRPGQVELLVSLLDQYLGRMEDRIAHARRVRIEESDLSRITFAWAGATDPGEAHYYRIQGPTFLIEYDNTQNNANHIHSVWRDFDGDFGRDLLREHYREAPHPY